MQDLSLWPMEFLVVVRVQLSCGMWDLSSLRMNPICNLQSEVLNHWTTRKFRASFVKAKYLLEDGNMGYISSGMTGGPLHLLSCDLSFSLAKYVSCICNSKVCA